MLRPRIMVFGTFDRLHAGHEFLLKAALSRGELTVIIARDENVFRLKGKHPVQTDDQRRRAVEKRFPAAHVLLGDREDFLVPVRTLKPDLILLGYDQKLPPSVTEKDLETRVERLPAYRPDIFKSSLQKSRKNDTIT